MDIVKEVCEDCELLVDKLNLVTQHRLCEGGLGSLEVAYRICDVCLTKFSPPPENTNTGLRDDCIQTKGRCEECQQFSTNLVACVSLEPGSRPRMTCRSCVESTMLAKDQGD